MPTVPIQAQIDWTNRARVAITDLIGAIDRLQALRSQWDYLGFSASMDAKVLENTPHDGLTAEQIAAALTTAEEIQRMLKAGHGTNLYRLLWPIR